MQKQFLLNTSWKDGQRGPDGEIIRMSLRPIEQKDVLEAMKNNFFNYNSGIISERYANELIRHFDLTWSTSESYLTGNIVFKKLGDL